MPIKKQNNSITKARNNDLRTLLKSEDSRALVKYVSTLRESSIAKSQTEGSELMVAIQYFRSRYSKLKAWEESGIATKEHLEDLAYVERKGKELKAQYDDLQVQPTLSELARQNEDDLVADITLLIIDLDESFNIGKGLSVPQIEHLSISIVQRMGSLTLDDIALCFYRAKCGDYGQVYDRLDLNVINTWLNRYLNERMELLSSKQQNRHIGSKQGTSYDPKIKQSVLDVANDRGIKNKAVEDFKPNDPSIGKE